MKHVSIFSMLLGVTLLATSCSKGSDGAAGPTGPAGANGTNGTNGAAGTTGAKGDPGAKGDTGTANVIYSDWLPVTFTGSDDDGYTATITAPELTGDVMMKGEVKVYYNLSPIYDDGDVTNFNVTALPGFGVKAIVLALGSIYLDAETDMSSHTFPGGKLSYFRYVIIPGGTKAGSKINWNNYKEVQKYLDIKN